MEVVILSDTVRRLQQKNSIDKDKSRQSQEQDLPDLLSFRHSQSSADQSMVEVAEVKEKNLPSKMSVKNIEIEKENVEQIVDILESCHDFEPSQPETVLVFDVDSFTDSTESTPIFKRKYNEIVEEEEKSLVLELEDELNQVSKFLDNHGIVNDGKMERISPTFISEIEDSDNIDENATTLKSDVQELDDKDSLFSPSDSEDQFEDEPLVFSEDEDVPRYSIEMDSDSDVVFLKNSISLLYFKISFELLKTFEVKIGLILH